MLYIVSTPIGNLKDISSRALEILGFVDIILAESPKDSLKLLNHYGIRKEIIPYNDRNKQRTIGKILNLLSGEEGKNAAYISSAGTPGISDPGQDLVKAARQAGIGVNTIPGPSALVSALAVSGIRARQFTFISFPPKKAGPLLKIFGKYKSEENVVAFFESPYRVVKTMEVLYKAAPESYVFAAKEMTKMFENYFYGTPQEVISQLQEKPKNLKGEFTIIVDFSVK